MKGLMSFSLHNAAFDRACSPGKLRDTNEKIVGLF